MIAKPKPLKPRQQAVPNIFESSFGYCLRQKYEFPHDKGITICVRPHVAPLRRKKPMEADRLN
jgi:hypothetical protein